MEALESQAEGVATLDDGFKDFLDSPDLLPTAEAENTIEEKLTEPEQKATQLDKTESTDKADQKNAPEAKEPTGWEEYEALHKSRGWDPTKPEYAKQITKSYSELEKAYSKATNEKRNLLKRDEETIKSISGSIDEINAIRERVGVHPLPKPIDYSKEQETIRSIHSLAMRALQGDSDSADELESLLNDKLHEHKLNEERSKYTGAKAKTLDEYKNDAKSVYGTLVAEDQKAGEYLEQIADYLLPETAIGSTGANIYRLMAHEDTARQLVEIGKRLHMTSPENFDKIVNERVDAELKRRANASGMVPAGREIGTDGKGKPDQDGFEDFR